MSALMDHVLVSAGGKFGESTESKVADVARLLDLAVEARKPKGLLLHFHGGLVKKADGLGVASRLTSVYTSAGTYPIFFVWESGFAEALLNNKEDLARDPAFRELVKKVSEWVLKRIGGSITFKGTGNAPVDVARLRSEYDKWFQQVRPSPPVPDSELSGSTVITKGADNQSVDDLATDIEDGLDEDPDFRRAIEQAYNAQLPADTLASKGAGTKERATVLLLSDDAQAEMFSKDQGVATKGGILAWFVVAKFVAKIVITVLTRYRKGRDHGVYCTIVEEVLRSAYGGLVGSAVWNQMKKDTADSFLADPQCCGTGVVDYLKSLEGPGGTAFPQITLVGHSTGAIYICNFLDAAAAADIKTPIKVAWLAPAVRHDRFAAAIKLHAGSSRIADFRMFAMDDASECDDKMLGVIYTRSLLYFVSGLTEGSEVQGEWRGDFDMPLVGLQRYLESASYGGDEFGAVSTVKAFLNAAAHRTVWSPADGGPGLSSNARRHGDFDNDEATLASVTKFV